MLAFTIGGLRDDANALRLALDRTSDAVRTIDKEGIQRTNDVSTKLSEQIQGLRVDFVRFGSNLEQMSTRLDQSNKSVENLSSRLEGFGSNLDKMSARLDQSNKSIENLSNQLEKFQNQLVLPLPPR
jgi:chromosome segregation ATPase